MAPALEGEKLLLDVLDGFIRSKVLMTAFKMDLFTRLEREALTLDDIRAAFQLPDRSGAILVNACAALGLLTERDGRYSTPPALAPFLRKGPNEPARPTTDLIAYYDEVYAALVDMEGLVRSDGATSTFKRRDYFHDDVTRVKPDVAANYSAYLDTTVAKIVDVVLKTYDFSKRSTLLDLCGCTGAFVTGVL
ncbi:MAG: hypothetical protein JNG84_01385, partial [Archangium sp.]|nr:hypothetical protein [Archangium sp.]